VSLLSGGLSRLGGALTGAIGGLAKGGITGAIGGAIGGLVGGTVKTLPGGGAPPAFGGGGIFGGPINIPFPVKGPGGIPLPGFGPGTAVATACPKGYHLNRKTLGASKRHGAVPAGTMCVRNRHINPLNAKAITRSLRRVKRARKLVSKLQSFGGARRITSGGHKPGCGCFRCRKR